MTTESHKSNAQFVSKLLVVSQSKRVLSGFVSNLTGGQVAKSSGGGEVAGDPNRSEANAGDRWKEVVAARNC